MAALIGQYQCVCVCGGGMHNYYTGHISGLQRAPSTPLVFMGIHGRIGPQHPLGVHGDPG